MKIICIGKNYHSVVAKAGIRTPKYPVVFVKPDSAILPSNNPFFIPQFSSEISYEAELIVRVCKLGRCISQKFAHKYYDAISVGMDLTAQDLYDDLSSKGLPWEISKGFDGSAVIGRWVDKEKLPDVDKIRFSMEKNDETVQFGDVSDMIFSVDRIIEYVSKFYTLKIGDIIFTGSPLGAGKMTAADVFRGRIEEEEVFCVKVK